jgi:hypothetical protein
MEAAAIIESVIVSDRPQIDGRRHIHERHIDSAGRHHDYFWMAEPGLDTALILADRAAALPNQILRRLEDKETQNGLYAS